MHISRLVRCFLFALLILVIPASSFAGVFISVAVAPPVLPVYAQPPCPGDGYIWTPGYWAYGPDGYYWVPGTWVLPPTVGVLWTPGFWGWNEGVYVWHAGYWGPHIGFYGGVNYGFGYFGTGYAGGYWRGGTFFYNRTVNNVTITNVHIYNKTVINNVTVNRVSYNGGHGGINARPTREQEGWAHERHFEATGMQTQHEHSAAGNRAFLASENHGRPAIAATARPGEFQGRGVVAARSGDAAYRPTRDHATPRPPASTREAARPMAGQSSRVSRAPQPERSVHQSAPRPSSYRPQNARPQNARPENSHPRESAPQHENQPHANGHHEERHR
jgi:YXWGXW repeat-containing protein